MRNGRTSRARPENSRKRLEAELEELTRIHVDRGLDRDLAEKAAIRLTERGALGSHARDELGISGSVTARPIQAALVSVLTFVAGAVIP